MTSEICDTLLIVNTHVTCRYIVLYCLTLNRLQLPLLTLTNSQIVILCTWSLGSLQEDLKEKKMTAEKATKKKNRTEQKRHTDTQIITSKSKSKHWELSCALKQPSMGSWVFDTSREVLPLSWHEVYNGHLSFHSGTTVYKQQTALKLIFGQPCLPLASQWGTLTHFALFKAPTKTITFTSRVKCKRFEVRFSLASGKTQALSSGMYF